MESKHIVLIILIYVTFSNAKNFTCNYKSIKIHALNQTADSCEFYRAFFKPHDTFNITIKAGNSSTDIDDLVTYIHFKSSNLALISNQIFLMFPNIQIFNASYTKLKKIDSFSFNRNVAKLTHILLHHNKINNIGDNVLEHCAELKILDLSHNEISEVGKLAFEKLRNLEELNLSFNKIKNLHGEAFISLQSLAWLWLNHNQFIVIPSKLFTKANKALKGIFFENNKINATAPNAFRELNNLGFLLLSNNKCINRDFKNFIIHDNVSIAHELKTCLKNYRKLYPNDEERDYVSELERAMTKLNECQNKKLLYNDTIYKYNEAIKNFE